MYITVGCEGSTAIEFCAALPAEQVAKAALAFGALLTPVITTIKLANIEKTSNREVVRCCREVKVRFKVSHLPVVGPPLFKGLRFTA